MLQSSLFTIHLWFLIGAVAFDLPPPGKHSFPHDAVDVIHGNLLSHELQLIKPEGIIISLDSSYIFSNIGPLNIANDDVVNVTFSSINPSSTDWIGAYSPANVDITKTVPVKYGWCDDGIGGSYLDGDNVTLHFNLTNLRAGVKFYFFRSSDPSSDSQSTALKSPGNYIFTLLMCITHTHTHTHTHTRAHTHTHTTHTYTKTQSM